MTEPTATETPVETPADADEDFVWEDENEVTVRGVKFSLVNPPDDFDFTPVAEEIALFEYDELDSVIEVGQLAKWDERIMNLLYDEWNVRIEIRDRQEKAEEITWVQDLRGKCTCNTEDPNNEAHKAFCSLLDSYDFDRGYAMWDADNGCLVSIKNWDIREDVDDDEEEDDDPVLTTPSPMPAKPPGVQNPWCYQHNRRADGCDRILQTLGRGEAMTACRYVQSTPTTAPAKTGTAAKSYKWCYSHRQYWEKCVEEFKDKPKDSYCPCVDSVPQYCSEHKQYMNVCSYEKKTGCKNVQTTGGMGYGTYQKCRHYQQKVKLPDGTIVYASSSHSDRKDDPIPDLGIYFDGCWKPDTIAYHIGCPDMGVPIPDPKKVITILREGLRVAREGGRVELGCIGGHGRTGLGLALMVLIVRDEMQDAGKKRKLNGKQAVDYVQKHYCDNAVESDKQEWYAEGIACELIGRKWPEPPKKKVYSYTPSTTTTTPTPSAKGGVWCQQHQQYWKEGTCEKCHPKSVLTETAAKALQAGTTATESGKATATAGSPQCPPNEKGETYCKKPSDCTFNECTKVPVAAPAAAQLALIPNDKEARFWIVDSGKVIPAVRKEVDGVSKFIPMLDAEHRAFTAPESAREGLTYYQEGTKLKPFNPESGELFKNPVQQDHYSEGVPGCKNVSTCNNLASCTYPECLNDPVKQSIPDDDLKDVPVCSNCNCSAQNCANTYWMACCKACYRGDTHVIPGATEHKKMREEAHNVGKVSAEEAADNEIDRIMNFYF